MNTKPSLVWLVLFGLLLPGILLAHQALDTARSAAAENRAEETVRADAALSTGSAVGAGQPDTTLTLRATEALSVVVLGGDGQPLDPSQFELTWSSANPSVLSASPEGVVATLAEGEPLEITVVARRATEPLEPRAADPSAEQLPQGLIWADDFYGHPEPRVRVGAPGWTRPHGGSAVRVESESLSFHFPGGPNQSAEANFTLGSLYQEIWIEYDLWIPENYEYAGGGSNKFFSIWDGGSYPGGGAGRVSGFVGAFRGRAGTVLRASFSNVDAPTMSAVTRVWEPGITDADKGRWNQLRFHFKVGTYAPNDTFRSKDWGDGLFEMWWNGRRVINGPMGYFHPDPSMNGFQNGYILGWSNPGFRRAVTLRIDNLRVYDEDPGW